VCPLEGPIAPHLEIITVYVIRSVRDKSIYIGYTVDLRRRLQEHNASKSKATRLQAPYEIIYYEAYKAKGDAKYRERNLKRFAQAYSQLRKRIHGSLV
jgi:putative endonuclease